MTSTASSCCPGFWLCSDCYAQAPIDSNFGVLQLQKQLINVDEAARCWTWVNKVSMVSNTAGTGGFFLSLASANTADVLLQQPVMNPLSAAFGQKPVAKPFPSEEPESTAARPSGDNGIKLPEQLIGIAAGELHKASTVRVCHPAVYVYCRACAAVDCFEVSVALVTVAHRLYLQKFCVQGIYLTKHVLASVHLFVTHCV